MCTHLFICEGERKSDRERVRECIWGFEFTVFVCLSPCECVDLTVCDYSKCVDHLCLHTVPLFSPTSSGSNAVLFQSREPNHSRKHLKHECVSLFVCLCVCVCVCVCVSLCLCGWGSVCVDAYVYTVCIRLYVCLPKGVICKFKNMFELLSQTLHLFQTE